MDMCLQFALQTQILCCTCFAQSMVTQAARLIAEADLTLDSFLRLTYYDEARDLLQV